MRPSSHRELGNKNCSNCQHCYITRHFVGLICLYGEQFEHEDWEVVSINGKRPTDFDIEARLVYDDEICDEWQSDESE